MATYRSGKRGNFVLRVNNAGSVASTEAIAYGQSLSGGSLTSAATLAAITRSVKIAAGATKNVPLPVLLPTGLLAGAYTLTVAITPATGSLDSNAADKTVSINFTIV